MSARRAVWRWGWRLLKKDWRDQSLIVALIVVASALSVAGGLLAIQALPDAGLESATLFSLDGEPADVARATATFGDDAGEIQRGDAQLAAVLEPISVRTLDPEHPQTSNLIDVLHGRLPVGPTEIAVGYAANKLSVPAAIGGLLLAIAGILLLTPATISTIGVLAGRAVMPTRIAGPRPRPAPGSRSSGTRGNRHGPHDSCRSRSDLSVGRREG